ncbi:MAG: asparaginase [Clostridia bacterium]|nr:asparaginase [Clostridia bacterium]
MKNILIIHTGGTIGSFANENARKMNKETEKITKRVLIENLEKSNSAFRNFGKMLEFADFSWENTTLSESMTFAKLSALLNYIKNVNLSIYDGIIVLHGTDTLAYTASLLSFFCVDFKIPVFIVSGNRPPQDALSNANDNFKTAIELIWNKIAPNVYVTYRNSDNITRLYLASAIMQSENYSDDFRIADSNKAFEVKKENSDEIKEKCSVFSINRKPYKYADIKNFENLSEKVLLIKPYTNIDYSVYSNAMPDCSGIVHGSYHSGTVALGGLVFKEEAENQRIAGNTAEYERLIKEYEKELNSKYSIKFLADSCKENNIPLYIAPSKLGKDQYETMNEVVKNTNAKLLDMTTESAFMKLSIALSFNMTFEQISEYMETEINNEFN